MTSTHPIPPITPWPKPRVLVVDDEPEVLEVLARMLRPLDLIIDRAESGDTAIALLDRHAYHAVVTDVLMPGISGLELLRAIRRRDLDLPVVLITGAPTVADAVDAVEHGAMRYLVKPVDAEKLVSVVNQAAKLYRIAVLKRHALEQLGGQTQSSDRIGLEVTFDSALENLFMVYQPIVRWSTREIAGYEALVRSGAPALPHPGALFDVATRLHRLDDLGRRIRALAPRPFLDAPERACLFLNLHVRDLVDDTLFDRTTALAKSAKCVVLEITERAALEDVGDARERIAELRRMGFRIALDDLGAGYAGLSSFAVFEPEVVKLDMTLIRDIETSPTKQKLVRSMALVCKDMGMEVVAEGVETAAERNCVVDLGCDLLQGYLFARPGAPFPAVSW